VKRLLLAAAALTLVALPLGAQTPKHNCSFCHDLHGGSFAALTGFATSQAVCESCHGEAGPAEVLRDGILVPVPKNVAIHNGGKHTTPTSCWNCHDHEGEASGNLSMIPRSRTGAANSTTRTVLFTALTGTNSFADGDATYDGVCEVCHTITDFHQFDGGMPAHNSAANCTTCHKHDGGFQGAGGGCTGCHNQTQGARRAILGEFGRTSHHVDWQTAGYLAADSIPDSDCETCHDQSQHQQGSVRLWNVDDPGNTAASIVLTADPYTNTTEAAKLEPFCLNCHDANGAAGDTIPFSDGIPRPKIDATAWPAASHSTTASIPAGCYGNGASGCHATGHGSQKADLLGPPSTAATAPALAEEQEGFCFNCHDSGGPAATDIATLFGATVLWVPAPVGDAGNLNLNDRHDVQHAAQTQSGAKIECSDCHDPHSATAAQPWKTDPDPNDGRVPGTGQVMAGVTKLSEFCLDCHDGSYPSTVVGPTTALTNVRTTHTTDAMGAGPSNASLKAGYGWASGDTMDCASCHDPHVSTNLFHAVPTVLSKDGTTPVPSDGGAYSLTDNSVKSPPVNGYDWCNTCHTNSMGDKKDNCFACHFHGTRW
jgi:hypothetical protein